MKYWVPSAIVIFRVSYPMAVSLMDRNRFFMILLCDRLGILSGPEEIIVENTVVMDVIHCDIYGVYLGTEYQIFNELDGMENDSY